MVRVDLSSPAKRDAFGEWKQTSALHLAFLGETYVPTTVDKTVKSELEAGRTRPLAAVVDIDEILLCNIRTHPGGGVDADWVERTFPPLVSQAAGLSEAAQAFVHAAADFTETWPPDSAWAHLTADNTGLNPPMAGAREFLASCHRNGVRIFLVTGREEYLRADTVTNLEIVGMLGAHTGLSREDLMKLPAGREELNFAYEQNSTGVEDSPLRLIMWPAPKKSEAAANAATAVFPTVAAYKTAARQAIARDHCIVLNVGDQLSDLGEHGAHQVLIPHSFYHTI